MVSQVCCGGILWFGFCCELLDIVAVAVIIRGGETCVCFINERDDDESV